MVRYGLSALDALYTATRNSGEFLGEPICPIAPAMLADVIMVEGDPLSDINAVATVRPGVANASPHRPSALLTPSAAPVTTTVRNRAVPPPPPDQRFFCKTAQT